MANTTNFNWETPDDTDLVKDGAAAIRTLGSAIDTSLVDLKGGTTGQVLSKATNTDMDFTWVAQDDSNAIQNAIVDAKGDLISATAADTPARLAVGANNTVLTADSSTATGLKWATPASGGGMTLINTGGTTMTGSSITISSIPSGYNSLWIYIVLSDPTDNGNGLRLRFNADSTANRHAQNGGSFYGDNITFNQTSVPATFSQHNGTPKGVVFLEIPYYADTTIWKYMRGTGVVNSYQDQTKAEFIMTSGAYNQTDAITSLEFFFNTGNMDGGTIYVYGVK